MAEKKKFYIETFGCQMNVHDSEKAGYLLSSIGYEAGSSPEESDLVILNTCSVREKAAQKVFARIRELNARSKKSFGQRKIFGVMGCVAQAEAEQIFEKAPPVRIVLGPRSISKLPELVDQINKGFPRAIDVRRDQDPDFLQLDPLHRNSPYLAYITIIEGCNKFCTYCIVPFTRGRERSRPAASVLAEAISLAKAGYKEVHLLGQNVNSYRDELTYGRQNKPGEHFAALLRTVAIRSGLPRIKFTTSFPRDFCDAIVDVMDEFDNLCNWVHLPVQSGSNRILKLMKRYYTVEEYLRKVERIKRSKRDIALTGDIIVGFPGESDEDFKQTLALVKEVEYDGLYMFKYSPRPYTKAAMMPDDVSPEVKSERFAALEQVQTEVQKKRYQRYLGRTLEVLVEGRAAKGQGQLTGHSTCHRVVNFYGEESLIGSLIDVKITELHRNSLFGEMVSGRLRDTLRSSPAGASG